MSLVYWKTITGAAGPLSLEEISPLCIPASLDAWIFDGMCSYSYLVNSIHSLTHDKDKYAFYHMCKEPNRPRMIPNREQLDAILFERLGYGASLLLELFLKQCWLSPEGDTEVMFFLRTPQAEYWKLRKLDEEDMIVTELSSFADIEETLKPFHSGEEEEEEKDPDGTSDDNSCYGTLVLPSILNSLVFSMPAILEGTTAYETTVLGSRGMMLEDIFLFGAFLFQLKEVNFIDKIICVEPDTVCLLSSLPLTCL